MLFSWQWELEFVLRLALALLLGGWIGYQRESLNQVAGFKTHILVCVGSCMIMIVSLCMPFIRYPGELTQYANTSADTARIAAQVVSGIGFLGAGAIIKSGMSVKGLTTAASLWAIAGLGLCIGAGMYILSIAGTILIFLTLTLFSKMEKRMQKKRIIVLRITMLDEACAVGKIFELFNSLSIQVKNTNVLEEQIGQDTITLDLMLRLPVSVDIEHLMSKLERMPNVYEVEYGK